ncbi:MAG TPA: hypothetical protein VMS40_08005 [Vicinamibacterales bacterium]|nr:hypothetical protein [Vicinamibacterales bacterium]
MNSTQALVISVSLVVSSQVASAQELSRYRVYMLESSVDAVVTSIGARATAAQTLHERPAKIQELQWRAPYANPGSESVDPVRDIAFSFVNDALYQVLVTYDRDRTAGLTNDDLIESLSASYGPPVLKSAIVRTDLPSTALDDGTVLAQWSDAVASLTLVRDTYTPDFQLILVSRALSAKARSATREAVRLDALEAPQRELEQRKKDVAEASATRDKTRSENKAAFRP